MTVGFAEGLSFDLTRSNWMGDGPRPLRWSAWYPSISSAQETLDSEPSWFESDPIARNAPLLSSAKPHPLVLLSHGTGGLAKGLEWLARRLAKSGFVALAVDHHGNNGSEPYRAEGFLCLWERATDLSALLDSSGWREQLGGGVATRASVAGFSAGAYAASLLVGARVEYSQFESKNPEKSPITGPKEFPRLADRIPKLLETSDTFKASWLRRRKSYKDARVTAAFLMAPGRSVRGFSANSLEKIDTPMKITVGGGDTIAPAPDCALWLHRRVPSSSLEIIGPKVGHYIFLPRPTRLGLRAAPEIFIDDHLIDRGNIHDVVAASAIKFFRDSA